MHLSDKCDFASSASIIIGSLWRLVLQNTYEKKLDLSDVQYTAKVDDGSYTNFVKDSAGYGLAQWTYWSRKQALQEYAKASGKSVGDLDM